MRNCSTRCFSPRLPFHGSPTITFVKLPLARTHLYGRVRLSDLRLLHASETITSAKYAMSTIIDIAIRYQLTPLKAGIILINKMFAENRNFSPDSLAISAAAFIRLGTAFTEQWFFSAELINQVLGNLHKPTGCRRRRLRPRTRKCKRN